MEKYKVHLSAAAKKEANEIFDYISLELCAPIAALDQIDLIEEQLAKLSQFPHGNPRISDDRLAAKGYRMIVIKNYLVFYTINDQEKIVYVERILYGRRDWMRTLRKDSP